jgi:hypothetical protein
VFVKEKMLVYIDSNKIFPSKSIQDFKPDTYTTKAWTPGYILLEDTFPISEGKIRFRTSHLLHTSKYKHYRDMRKTLLTTSIT